MAGKRYLVQNNRGGGVSFKTAEEADAWVKANPSYKRVTQADVAAAQKRADEEVAEKAQAKSEDKAVNPAVNKSQG